MARYWWVNQKQSYASERREGILWAPYRTADGRSTRSHWDNMEQVEPGDLVLHYADQSVRAISSVLSGSVPSRRPESLPTDMWEQDGRLVRTDYRDATEPVHREEIPEGWRLAEPEGSPFQVDAGVKVGYLFLVTEGFFRAFEDRFGSRFTTAPARPEVPPEALEGAGDLLRRLIGVPLQTVSGRPNLILGVRGQQVYVRTERSPEGRAVPISEVQEGLDRLVASGSLMIHPDEAGYRSAFVGAVLTTLPGATVSGTPPILTLAGSTEPNGKGDPTGAGSDQGNTALTFQGDLAVAISGMARGEQAQLRRRLFGSAAVANCALCGEQLPVRFLWAAHIKKRSVCTDEERRDIGNVGMPACVFGCDALFESGHLAVDATGHVLTATTEEVTAVRRRMDELSGRGCLAFTASSAHYFEWHRENVWKG